MFSALKPMIKKALKDLSPQERDELIDDLLPKLFEDMSPEDRIKLTARITGLAAASLSQSEKATLLKDLSHQLSS